MKLHSFDGGSLTRPSLGNPTFHELNVFGRKRRITEWHPANLPGRRARLFAVAIEKRAKEKRRAIFQKGKCAHAFTRSLLTNARLDTRKGSEIEPSCGEAKTSRVAGPSIAKHFEILIGMAVPTNLVKHPGIHFVDGDASFKFGER